MDAKVKSIYRQPLPRSALLDPFTPSKASSWPRVKDRPNPIKRLATCHSLSPEAMLLQDFLLACGRGQCAPGGEKVTKRLGCLVQIQFMVWIQVMPIKASALLLGGRIVKQIIKVISGTVH
jgi:hypothetical protein